MPQPISPVASFHSGSRISPLSPNIDSSRRSVGTQRISPAIRRVMTMELLFCPLREDVDLLRLFPELRRCPPLFFPVDFPDVFRDVAGFFDAAKQDSPSVFSKMRRTAGMPRGILLVFFGSVPKNCKK